jgi:DNA-binding SARP family transcriptional activator
MLDLRATNAKDNQIVDVIAVDLADPGLSALGPIRHVSTADDIVGELEARAKAIGDSLATVHRPNTFAGRAGAFGEDFGFAPLVVFINAASVSARTAERICELADGGGLGLAAVFVGEHSAPTWLVDVEGDELRISSLNLAVRRTIVDGYDVRVLEGVLGATPAPLISTPVRVVEEINAAADEIDLREEVEGHEIEIRVVGPVDAVSVNGMIEFTKAMELVTFLLFHRETMSIERVSTALFPGQPVNVTQIHQLVEQANVTLGRPTTGGTYVIMTERGLRLSPLVGTDLDVLLLLADNASQQAPADAILTLSNALDVVRGVPFDGVRNGTLSNAFAWVHAEGLLDKVDAVIVDVAHRLAELCLDADDAPGALWAVNQGLLASPLNELLYCDRMLAHYSAGDRNGIIATMNDLERAIAAAHNGATVTGETRALYTLLLRDQNAEIRA